MTHSNSEHQRIKDLLARSGLRRSILWSLQLARGTAPRLFKVMTGCFAAEAFIPVASTAAIGVLASKFKDVVSRQQVDLESLMLWLVITVSLLTVEFLLGETKNYCRSRLVDETGISLQKTLYQHAARMDLAFFEESESLNRMFRATSGGNNGAVGPIHSALSGVSGLFQILSLFGLMVYLQPWLAIVLLVAGIPLVIVGSLNSIEKYKLNIKTTRRLRLTRYYTSMIAGERNVPVTKILNLSTELIRRFEAVSRSLIEEKKLLFRKISIRLVCSVLLYMILLFSVIGWLMLNFSHGNVEAGVVAAFMLAAFRSQRSISQVSNAMAAASDASLSIIPLIEFLEIEPSITDQDGFAPAQLQGEIVLDEVGFTYPQSHREIIRGLSFTIPAGQKVAIVGTNGAGKTTLFKLISRFYDVDRGSIRIDGHDVRSLSLRWLHDHLAMVFQSPTQYEATVYENIAFGDWERLKDSDASVRELARTVGLDDFIDRLPNGYETHLGRLFGEVTLSGGQWQLLSVARALARKESILILDEPTSNLDINAEVAMFRAIRELAHDRTVIFISHRFSTVMEADRILVVDDGQLVEDGTHAELMAAGKFYAQMVRQQKYHH